MKSMWTVALMVVAFVVGATAASAAKVVVEAEHYLSIKASMSKMSDSKASAGKCIGIPLRRPHATSETGPSDDGHAYYKVKIPKAGTYQFWGRCWWYDSCGNSFFVLVDSTKVTSKTPYVTDQTFRKWHWVAGPKVSLSKGTHTIRIRNREDGAKMDQWLLTTTPKNRWVPTRVEKETPAYIIKLK